MPSASDDDNINSTKVGKDYISFDGLLTSSKNRTPATVIQYTAWTTSSGIMDAFPNRPLHVVDIGPTSALLALLKHQRTVTILPSPSAITNNKCDEFSTYNSNPRWSESVNLSQYLAYVNRPQ